MKPRAFVFDAYAHCLMCTRLYLRAGNVRGDAQALSILWRQKQLEYTWLRSLMERYEDFWDVTEAALSLGRTATKIEASDAQVRGLMQAFLPRPYFLT